MSNRPIGVVDSGFGGLTVLKEALKQLPEESYIYIGDNGRAPYGPRPFSEIQVFMRQIADFLVDHYDIKILVVACNTATVAALDDLTDYLPIPVIGVISAGSQAAALISDNHRIGVIGTKGTIDSDIYPETIKSYQSNSRVYSLACPEFVTWVEEGRADDEQTDAFVAETLQPLKDTEIDTLVLGCTHFPIIRRAIQKAVGPDVTLVDAGVETIQSLKETLAEKNLKTGEQSTGNLRLYTTGDLEKFNLFVSKWLNRDALDVRQLTIEGGHLHEADNRKP